MTARKQIIESDVPAIREPIPAAPAYGNVDRVKLVFKDDFVMADTETTGVDPDADAIIEVGMLRFRGGNYATPDKFHTLVNPGFPIPPQASAVNHITDEDVRDKPAIEQVRPQLEQLVSGAYRVAWYAQFDAQFVDPALGEFPDAAKWLCAYRLARHVLPDAPAYGNNVLRYWLKTSPESEGLGAHRAIDDCHVSVENFFHCLLICQERGMTTLAQVRDLANQPIISDYYPFKKHFLVPLVDVPTPDLEWCLRNRDDMDSDLRVSFEREVARRPDRDEKGFSESGAALPLAPAEFMTFGKKYNTTPPTRVADVPSGYFAFLKEKRVRLEPSLQLAIDIEVAKRAANAALEPSESRITTAA
jgi:exodeoxyribonuclease X